MSERDVRLPLYHRLRDELAGLVAAGRWRPGEAIAPESELAATYGASVGTVRKALDLLAGEGLLERIQGKGTFVRRPNFESSLFRFFRFQDATGVRTVPRGRILSVAPAAAPWAVARELGLAPDAPAIRLARLRLIEGARVLLEDIWLPRGPFAPLLDLRPEEFGDLLYPVYEERCGQVVASAEETLTAEAAGAEAARLLGVKAGSPLIVIERLARGFDRGPLEWRRSLGPADRYRYFVKIH